MTGRHPRRSRIATRPAPPADAAVGIIRGRHDQPQALSVAEAIDAAERSGEASRACRLPHRGLVGTRVPLAAADGEGHWDFVRSGHTFYVVIGDAHYRTARVERFGGDGYVQFYFKLSGDLTLALHGGGALRVDQPCLLVFFQPLGVTSREWLVPGRREQSVTLSVHPDLLRDLLDRNSPAVLRRLADAAGRRAIEYRRLPLTGEMYELASRLVHSPHQGAVWLLSVEAMALELVCAAIANLGELASRPDETLTQAELNALDTARRLVSSRFENPLTIRALAAAAGLSATRLKCGFKAVYGETIAACSTRCRMQRALELLRGRRLPVDRVAEAVGYRHPTSFATAFRRHYGIRPKDVRGRRGGSARPNS